MGSQRVGHDWATSLSLFTFMHWRRRWHLTPVFLPGESQGQRSLVGCRLWGHTESDMTEATWQQQPPPNSAHNNKLFSASVIWCRKSYNLYHFLRVHIKQYHMIFVFLYLTLLSMIVLWWDPLNSWCIYFSVDGWIASPTQKWIWALWEMVKDRETWGTAVHGVAKSQTRLSNWTTLLHLLSFATFL